MKSLVVITGASSGIGEAIARRFSEAGHPLLLVARRVERLEALNLPNTLCEKVDVTEAATLVAAIAKAEALYGPADLLVNNAGVMLLGQIDTQEANEWKRMFDVNVLGLLNGMHAVLAADDVARAVLFAYQQPQSVCIREIALAPTKQQP